MIMAIDFSVMSVVAYCLPDAKHNMLVSSRVRVLFKVLLIMIKSKSQVSQSFMVTYMSI